MQISVEIIELNERRHNTAIINGVRVTITDDAMQGTEKQIKWARDLMKKAFDDFARTVIKRAFPDYSGDADKVDELLGKLNQSLGEMATRIHGKHARHWIDNRHRDSLNQIRAVNHS